MKKIKTEEDYDKSLLRSQNAKRSRRKEDGFELVTSPPDFIKNPVKMWTQMVFEDKHMEGWEKLCVESYCCGWLAYYDVIVHENKIDHSIYFEWSDRISGKNYEGKADQVAGSTELTVYIDPGPEETATLLNAAAPSDPPKPPPPPMS